MITVPTILCNCQPLFNSLERKRPQHEGGARRVPKDLCEEGEPPQISTSSGQALVNVMPLRPRAALWDVFVLLCNGVSSESQGLNASHLQMSYNMQVKPGPPTSQINFPARSNMGHSVQFEFQISQMFLVASPPRVRLQCKCVPNNTWNVNILRNYPLFI